MAKSYQGRALPQLREQLETILIVHYSCQSLNDSNEGYSPRITSIVVHNFESRTSHSFSIHLEAEIAKISKDKIEEKYDDLEKGMLKNFYSFVKEHQNFCWLHWNMRNIHYGFETLEHRYRALGATNNDIPSIPDNKRFNLSDLITDMYGENCVSHPRMGKLMELNGGIPKGFLSGEEESKAFSNKEYIKLHESTLSKVGWFRKMFILLLNRKIRTERSNWKMRANEFCESIEIKVAGAISIFYAIGEGGIKIFNYFSSSGGIK